MKKNPAITNLHELEQVILRLRLETREATTRIEDELQYGRRNVLKLAINSIHCRKPQNANGDHSFIAGLYKEMTKEGIRAVWKAVRDYVSGLKNGHG